MSGMHTALLLPTDTEGENSFDLDKSFEDIPKKTDITAKRRSLFNVSIESNLLKPDLVRKSEEFKSLENRARKEMRDWRQLFVHLRSEVHKAREKHFLLDVSILSEKNRKFLLEEPDMDRYLRTLHEFQCNAWKFLDNEFIDMMQARGHLADLCEHTIRVAKQSKLNDLICSESII